MGNFENNKIEIIILQLQHKNAGPIPITAGKPIFFKRNISTSTYMKPKLERWAIFDFWGLKFKEEVHKLGY